MWQHEFHHLPMSTRVCAAHPSTVQNLTVQTVHTKNVRTHPCMQTPNFLYEAKTCFSGMHWGDCAQETFRVVSLAVSFAYNLLNVYTFFYVLFWTRILTGVKRANQLVWRSAWHLLEIWEVYTLAFCEPLLPTLTHNTHAHAHKYTTILKSIVFFWADKVSGAYPGFKHCKLHF